ncbi:hypothetical protein C7W93_21700 [Glaciimonas sp. PCH181]|nr:hypothetical protein C7W93_21700 [Glaciimonas sp. PCH181]
MGNAGGNDACAEENNINPITRLENLACIVGYGYLIVSRLPTLIGLSSKAAKKRRCGGSGSASN